MSKKESEKKQTHSESKKEKKPSLIKRIREALTGKRKELVEEAGKEVTEEKKVASGKLHVTYNSRIEEINKSETPNKGKDRETLKSTDVLDIRSNTRLLQKKEKEEKPKETITNVKAETARRIRAYTSEFDGEWYTLNYSSVGGYEHLMGVGLGDILLDTDIKEVLVLTPEGNTIKGTRGIAKSGKHKGRQCFLDSSGGYIATLDNYKFKILTDNEINTDQAPEEEINNYISSYNEETKVREEYKETAKTRRKYNANIDVEISGNDLKNANPISDEKVISTLNKHREENDGQEILGYARKQCEKFRIPWPIYRELVRKESNWNPHRPYEGVVNSDALGLGQFLSETWKGFMKHCNKNNIFHDEWGSPPLTEAHRTNPYINAYATAWLMSKTYDSFGGLRSKPLHEQAMVLYLAHNQGTTGAKHYLKFMETMQNEGNKTKGEIIAAYNANPKKYNEILFHKQIGRINTYGFNRFINVYFNFAKIVGINAAAGDPQAVAAIEKQKETV